MADTDFLSFLVEELIAYSAVGVSICGNASGLVDELDPVLRRRIQVIDDVEVAEQSRALIAPVFKELSVEFVEHEGRTVGLQHGKGRHPAEVEDAFECLFEVVPTFLLGMKHGLQIDVPLEALVSGLTVLRAHLRNPEGRAILASLEGVIRTYETIDVPGPALISRAGSDLAEQLAQLVEDQTYKEMSRHAHSLGFPTRIKRCLSMLRRKCIALLSQKNAKRVFRMASSAVNAATSVPAPDSEAMEALLKRGFLPPVVNLAPLKRNAWKACERADPGRRWHGLSW